MQLLLHSFACLGVAALFFLCSPGYASEYYKWTDENGNIHISDSLDNIPAKYRSQIESKRFNNNSDDSNAANDKPTPPKTSPQRSAGKPRPQKNIPVAEEKEGGSNLEKKLARYEVPYTPYEGSAKRVIISVTFNNSTTARMAIDTGAPGTVLSTSLARKLGLFDESQGRLYTVAGGIGGRAPAVRSIIDSIQVGGAKIIFVPTTIIAKMSDSFEGLLGLDFVANYSVTIDARRKMVVFEELPNDENHIGGHDQEWWTAVFREFGSSRADWKAYSDYLNKKIRESMTSVGNEDIDKKEFADYQCREADKLFDKLNRYAVQNAVPMHWRKY